MAVIKITLNEARSALSHSDWLEEKVAKSRAGLADDANPLIAPEAWDKVRAAKQAHTR